MRRTSFAIAVLIGAAAGALAAQDPVHDPDVFWHLATGRETLAHGLVRADVFSWTVAGSPVSVDQWLGQVMLYAAYVVGDWRGVIAVRAVSVALLIGLVAVNAMLARGDRPIVAVVATLPAIFLTHFVWVDRPELLGLVCVAALLVLLRLARDGSDGALFAVVPLLVIWANVHGSFALGVVLVLLVAVEGIWRDGSRRSRYAALAALAILAPIATPSGIGAWTAPGAHLLSPPREIQEWGVVDPRTQLGTLYVITLALVFACAFLGAGVPAREAAVLVPVALLSLTALRQTPLLAIAAAPLFASRIGEVANVVLPGPAAAPSRRAERFVTGFAAAFLAAAVVSGPKAPDESELPVDALSALPRGEGLFNVYDWGGWLTWRAPSTRVFVDGRLTPYRGATITDYRTIIAAAPGWRDVVARRGIVALLVRPSDPVAVRARDVGWRVIASSERFLLLVPR